MRILQIVFSTFLLVGAAGFGRVAPAGADGPWTPVGNLAGARIGPTATLLDDGTVLVVGGFGNAGARDGALATAERFDPQTGTWSSAGRLRFNRNNHTATRLPDGRVLVIGGASVGLVPPQIEVFDPATGAWSIAGTLLNARAGQTATPLGDGTILVAGGLSDRGATLAASELFDPATGTATATGDLTQARSNATATALPDGRVLVVGGRGGPDRAVLDSAEVYDPATGTWTATGSLGAARVNHQATLLPTGQVLVTGGTGAANQPLAATELYDPATGTWASAGDLAEARSGHQATLLPDGWVLITGGAAAGRPPALLASTEFYHPDEGTWTSGPDLVVARSFHAATVLANGQVLVVGGDRQTGQPLASAEISELNGSATSELAAPGAGVPRDLDFITTEVDQQFSVSLESNPTTGYRWQLAQPLAERIVTLIDATYQSGAPGLPGAGGQETWIFRATGVGQTTISLEYRRPWETTGEPAKRKAYTVTVIE